MKCRKKEFVLISMLIVDGVEFAYVVCIGRKLRLLNIIKRREMQIGIPVQQNSKSYGSARLTFILL